MQEHICLVGMQWGDEGKGKIVDVLSEKADAVARFQGGGNAGHTVWVDNEKYVTHHIPIGVLHDDKIAILGNGMVIDPNRFLEEYYDLTPDQQSRVRVSNRAHLILNKHINSDVHYEETAGKVKMFGSTKRGIGPAYKDKYARFGVRVGDTLRPNFVVEDSVDAENIRRFLEAVGDKICDTTRLLYDLDNQGASLLFEGAQGVLLDIEFGEYPYVTSSHCTFLGMGPGTGFSPRRVDKVIGVAKAYPTRIGTGPFPSHADPEDDKWLRERGNEFGATTGRPRKCGWLDIPALKFAAEISDIDEIALTKIDVLNGRKTIPVCVAYQLDGRVLDQFPTDTEDLFRVKPVYEQWPGWNDVSEIRQFVNKLEDAVEREVGFIGNGPDRKDIVRYEDL